MIQTLFGQIQQSRESLERVEEVKQDKLKDVVVPKLVPLPFLLPEVQAKWLA